MVYKKLNLQVLYVVRKLYGRIGGYNSNIEWMIKVGTIVGIVVVLYDILYGNGGWYKFQYGWYEMMRNIIRITIWNNNIR